MQNLQKTVATLSKEFKAPVVKINTAVNKQIDLFVELQSYRAIHDDDSRRDEADRLFKETKDLKKVDMLCKSFLLQDKSKELIAKSKINKRFYKASFDNYKVESPTQELAKNRAMDYVKKINSHLENGTNLAFAGFGCVGTGKTHLANAVAKALMTEKGIPCKFINVISLVSELKETFNIKEYTDIEVLVIDDLGKEKGTPWVCEQIYAIINKRYEQGKPTIITTEDNISILKNNYDSKGKAIISRFCNNFILIKLDGADYRLRGL